MSWRSPLALVVLFAFAGLSPAAEPRRGLDLYFVDTDGGAATLIVTPAGESVLIDCGNPGKRDAGRIHKAAVAAGVKAIDHLIVTHWHVDHYGGVAPLTKLMPVRRFYDRGIPDKLDEDKANFPTLIRAYRSASKGKSVTLNPGDEIKLRQAEGAPPVKLVCLCARGEVVPDRPGAPPNPVAREHKPKPEDKTDNARSLGFLLTFGGFRFLDLGDLTWNVEYKLVHPTDKVGPVDVYQVTHHGLAISNNPVLVKTVRPRVAIFSNGPTKGCEPSVMATLRRVPGIKGIYQIHRNLKAGDAENSPPGFIANPKKGSGGELIRVLVAPDARSYAVTVGSRGKPRRYETRAAEKGGKTGSVRGKVTYKGLPLPGGTIAFHARKATFHVAIDRDGTYSATDLPVGAAVVTVETESVNPRAAPAREKPPKAGGGAKYVPIPRKYAGPKTSALSVTIKEGRQTYDIDLRD